MTIELKPCPFCGGTAKVKNNFYTIKYREGCVRCKLAWLDREYDTYPSDDGVWERRTDGQRTGD